MTDPSNIRNLSRAENVLFSLALFAAVLLPPAAQYITGFSLLIWSLVTKSWGLAHFRDECVNPRSILHPFWVAMGIAATMTLLVGVLAYFDNPWVAHSGLYFKETFRHTAKQFLLPLILIVAFKTGCVRNYRIERDLPWLGLLAIVTIAYMVLQRYTGVDWIHGFGAQLPANRFNYGVYRANGWMSHPLSSGFNFMLLAVASYCVMRRLRNKPFHRFAVLFFLTGIAGLILSQSRWPLGVVAVVIALKEAPNIWRHRFLALAVIVGCIGFVSLDQGLRGRVVELFAPGQALEEKVERLIFWRVHTDMFKDHPMIGVGYPVRVEASLDYYNRAGYTNIERKYDAHNIYLQLLADSGIVGLSAFAVFVIGLWISAGRLGTDAGKTVRFLIISALLGGLMQNNFRDSEFLFGYWMLVAWLLCKRPLVASSLGHTRDNNNGSEKIKDHDP